jgi:DNA repair protein SbcC/Rad50
MGIADFFRPKHRHSDIRVRTEAVRALGTDDAAILETIAKTDRDASVRRIAIEKIATPELLADIANSDSEQGLADYAGERAASLWTTVACSADPDGAGNALSGLLKLGDHRAVADVAARAQVATVRRRALTEIRDPKALADLAKRDVAHEVRLEAVSRIDDSEVLRALAMDTTNKEVGLAAVDKIDDQTLLDLIANKAKNKGVRQRARKVLNEMEAAHKLVQGGAVVTTATVSDETKRRRAEKAQLLREVEALVEKYDLSKANQLVSLESKYAALDAGVHDASDEKFAAIIRKFAMRKQAAEQKVAQARQSQDLENERRQMEAQRAHAAREQAAADASDDIAAVLVDPAEEAKRQARRAEAEARRAQRDAWQAAELARREASDAERALKQKAKREREQEAMVQLGELVGQMEDAAAGRKLSFDRAESASSPPIADVVVGDALVDGATDNTVKRRRAKAPAAERLLEQAAKVYADVARVPESQRDAIETRYHTVRAALVSQMADKREAEDWARWNNVPQAESLIKVAKEMIDIDVGSAGSPNAGEVAGLLKELQQSWKEVGPLPQKKSKEMWDTFKAACDEVFDKIRGQRAVAAEKYVEIAAAKEKLIVDAEALSESTDWAATGKHRAICRASRAMNCGIGSGQCAINSSSVESRFSTPATPKNLPTYSAKNL